MPRPYLERARGRRGGWASEGGRRAWHYSCAPEHTHVTMKKPPSDHTRRAYKSATAKVAHHRRPECGTVLSSICCCRLRARARAGGEAVGGGGGECGQPRQVEPRRRSRHARLSASRYDAAPNPLACPPATPATAAARHEAFPRARAFARYAPTHRLKRETSSVKTAAAAGVPAGRGRGWEDIAHDRARREGGCGGGRRSVNVCCENLQ